MQDVVKFHAIISMSKDFAAPMFPRGSPQSDVVKHRSSLSIHHKDVFLAYIFGPGVLRYLMQKVATASSLDF